MMYVLLSLQPDMKKLYRSNTERVVWGILGGIGEYVGVDPTVVRIVFVILLLITGFFPFALLYLLGYYIIPKKPLYDVVDEQ